MYTDPQDVPAAQVLTGDLVKLDALGGAYLPVIGKMRCGIEHEANPSGLGWHFLLDAEGRTERAVADLLVPDSHPPLSVKVWQRGGLMAAMTPRHDGQLAAGYEARHEQARERLA